MQCNNSCILIIIHLQLAHKNKQTLRTTEEVLTDKLNSWGKPSQYTFTCCTSLGTYQTNRSNTCLAERYRHTSLQALPSDMQQKSMRGGRLATGRPMAERLVCRAPRIVDNSWLANLTSKPLLLLSFLPLPAH